MDGEIMKPTLQWVELPISTSSAWREAQTLGCLTGKPEVCEWPYSLLSPIAEGGAQNAAQANDRYIPRGTGERERTASIFGGGVGPLIGRSGDSIPALTQGVPYQPIPRRLQYSLCLGRWSA